MLFVMGLPIFQIILFCLSIGKDPVGLHLAIVNEELARGDYKCSYIPPRMFQKECENPGNDSVCPFVEYDCEVNMLSCQFLEILERRNQKLVSSNYASHSILLGAFSIY